MIELRTRPLFFREPDTSSLFSSMIMSILPFLNDFSSYAKWPDISLCSICAQVNSWNEKKTIYAILLIFHYNAWVILIHIDQFLHVAISYQAILILFIMIISFTFAAVFSLKVDLKGMDYLSYLLYIVSVSGSMSMLYISLMLSVSSYLYNDDFPFSMAISLLGNNLLNQVLLRKCNGYIRIILWCICFLGTIIANFSLYGRCVGILPFYFILQGISNFESNWLKCELHREVNEENSIALKNAIANAAHDMKTPLQSFILGIESLESLLKDINNHHKSNKPIDWHVNAGLDTLAALSTTSNLMSMAINRATDYAKLSRNIKLIPRVEELGLVDTVTAAVRCMQEIQERVHIDLEMTDVSHTLSVETDKCWLLDNLFCLLTNAIKYSDHGGVRVRLSMCGRGTEGVGGHEGGSTRQDIKVEVEDCGPGSPAALREMMFSPQIPELRTAGGAGLGLYCLSARTAALGGSCGVSPRERNDPGVVVWFVIPCSTVVHGSTKADIPATYVHTAVLPEITAKPTSSLGQPLAPISETNTETWKVAVSQHSDEWEFQDDSIIRVNGHLEASKGDEGSQQDDTPIGGEGEVLFGALRRMSGSVDECPVFKMVKRRSYNSLASAAEMEDAVDAGGTCNENGAPSATKRISFSRTSRASSNHTETSSCSSTASHRRVLVVDDSLMILKMTTKALLQEGFVVNQAENGAVALSMLMENRYDAVLMDIQMPIMDGCEAVKKLREHENRLLSLKRAVSDNMRRQFVVGMSASTDDCTRDAALKAGMDSFIPKPFTLDRFKRLLDASCINNSW